MLDFDIFNNEVSILKRNQHKHSGINVTHLYTFTETFTRETFHEHEYVMFPSTVSEWHLFLCFPQAMFVLAAFLAQHEYACILPPAGKISVMLHHTCPCKCLTQKCRSLQHGSISCYYLVTDLLLTVYCNCALV